jgi:DnaJ-domain-containing protein 1
VSISRRLYDLVRSNLTELGEKASDLGLGHRGPTLADMSDDQLEAELARRRERRDAARSTKESDHSRTSRPNSTQSERFRRSTRASSSRSGTRRDSDLARLYAQLECPYGADLTSVRKHYRRLMRKYHPDLHVGDADKQRIANELTQRLTSAYNELRRALATR